MLDFTVTPRVSEGQNSGLWPRAEQRGCCQQAEPRPAARLTSLFLLSVCVSLQARGADIPDIPGELQLRSCGSTASMKVKNVKKLSFTKGHFPKMAECAHFHYENVDFGNIQVSLGFLLHIKFTPCASC
ncbi:hypothetical protein EK904_008748 [Melospiza melodia maxima]|nr:hypothetical protein EK904_008748 [Melospiza melodia maxima]